MEENGSNVPDPSTMSVFGDITAIGACDGSGLMFSPSGRNFCRFSGVVSKMIKPVTAPGHFLPSRAHWEHSGVRSSHCIG